MANPDIIVIGAGHNGLVAAIYLAKAGRKVLVFFYPKADTPGCTRVDGRSPAAQASPTPHSVRNSLTPGHGCRTASRPPHLAGRPAAGHSSVACR